MKKILLILFSFFILLIAVSLLITQFIDGVSFKDKVALIYLEGPIIGSEAFIKELKEYVEDSAIKAVVIRVNSPGGGVAPSQEIYKEVKRAAKEKMIVVSMGAVAASGGYYVSAPADRIIANPGTITGSIGVIMEIPNVEGLMKKIGLKTIVIKSGRHKDLASAFREIDKEDRKILQNVIDDVYEQFIEDIASSRKMPLEEVRRLADGRIFSGRQALEVGLVDELGNLEDAIMVSARLAGIEGKPEVVTKKEEFSLSGFLQKKFSGALPDIFPQVKLKYMFMP